ncbi:MAG TPA: N-acetyl-1-D-myo-inositol-2-amino-2-deoxy-alpha-D-glucopyranoside deacetylase [Jatrophihabitans sp.]|nr:N-acetyl-1-D-myo-inositol-2-amino-2-deoxy-alpha-D-glucopyranoside deacetylase [Jatrophihabitans sp.]
MTGTVAARRLLLVHAHPDDETIGTGATMARYAAAGAHVCLVTCTLGEQGEILVPALSQLAADQADQLGGWRIHELLRALAELGVTDQRFLGGAGRFRDSGMMGDPANSHPRAFWRADAEPAVFDTAVGALVAIVRELRPQVVVTYDDHGGYGHPDHIMAHRVCTAAVKAAAEPGYPAAGRPWRVDKLYWTGTPRSVAVAGQRAMADAGSAMPFQLVHDIFELPYLVADELVTTAISAPGFGEAKARALAAHATQLTVRGQYFALSNNIGQQVLDTEYFRLVSGIAGGERDSQGRENDLFGGLRLDDSTSGDSEPGG